MAKQRDERTLQRIGEYVEVKDARSDWYWRVRATNGNTIGGSSEGYRNLRDMRRAKLTLLAVAFAALEPDDREFVTAYADERDAQAEM